MNSTAARETLPIIYSGAPLGKAAGALILLHGRGGSPDDMLQLGDALAGHRLALMALQAPDHTWYPYSFLTPRQQNEPYLSSALQQVEAALDLTNSAGVPTSQIAVCGFSQGACLATKFVARHPQRYAGLLAFTGGLIGPLEEPLSLSGDLAGTAVLLSSGDPDPHVPWKRVLQSGELLTSIGGQVSLQRYAGKPHSVSLEEVEQGRGLLSKVLP